MSCKNIINNINNIVTIDRCMTSLPDNVHIIPLGHEYDRAIAPFRKKSVDRIYILSVTKNTGTYEDEMVNRQVHFTKKVQDFFKKKNAEVISLEVHLFDLLEVMKVITAIIRDEQKKGNDVSINMSACGRKTSIGAALAGMAHGVNVYYVSAETYALDYATFWDHGLSICEKGDTFKFENFEFDLPDKISQMILVKLFRENRGIRSTEIRDFLNEQGVEGFEIRLADVEKASKSVKPPNREPVDKRSESITQNIRLEKKYLGRLESSKYIRREKSGKNNILYLTDAGKYIACITGDVELPSLGISRK